MKVKLLLYTEVEVSDDFENPMNFQDQDHFMDELAEELDQRLCGTSIKIDDTEWVAVHSLDDNALIEWY